jgi:ribosomal protein L29
MLALCHAKLKKEELNEQITETEQKLHQLRQQLGLHKNFGKPVIR